VLEAGDWLWYTAVPFVGDAAPMLATPLLPASTALALYAVGAVMALVLFLGIRNAWDITTYLVIRPDQSDQWSVSGRAGG
jgi:hypothetical protein